MKRLVELLDRREDRVELKISRHRSRTRPASPAGRRLCRGAAPSGLRFSFDNRTETPAEEHWYERVVHKASNHLRAPLRSKPEKYYRHALEARMDLTQAIVGMKDTAAWQAPPASRESGSHVRRASGAFDWSCDGESP